MGMIRLLETVQRGNRVEYQFESDLPYFKKQKFFVEYPGAALDAPLSIFNVIFAAAVMPVSWACGARVQIPCLDKAYAEAMPHCRDYFREWCEGKWRFGDNLETET